MLLSRPVPSPLLFASLPFLSLALPFFASRESCASAAAAAAGRVGKGKAALLLCRSSVSSSCLPPLSHSLTLFELVEGGDGERERERNREREGEGGCVAGASGGSTEQRLRGGEGSGVGNGAVGSGVRGLDEGMIDR